MYSYMIYKDNLGIATRLYRDNLGNTKRLYKDNLGTATWFIETT